MGDHQETKKLSKMLKNGHMTVPQRLFNGYAYKILNFLKIGSGRALGVTGLGYNGAAKYPNQLELQDP